MTMKAFNAPVALQIYLGSGKRGERLRENLIRRCAPKESVSELVLKLLKKADPALFTGVEDGKK